MQVLLLKSSHIKRGGGLSSNDVGAHPTGVGAHPTGVGAHPTGVGAHPTDVLVPNWSK